MKSSGLFPPLLAAIFISAFHLLSQQAQPPLDLLLTGARVLDGSGNPWFRRAVGIRGDRIAWVGEKAQAPAARQEWQLDGLYLLPGFIDLHSHTLEASFDPTRSAHLNYLFQGVTTLVTGNDGQGPWEVEAALEKCRRAGLGPNLGLLIGHGSLRRQVLGMENRAPSAGELQQMRLLLEGGMRQGALGLSSGLFYAPGHFADTEELIQLARTAAALGGYYDTHLRDESDYSVGLEQALEEALRIGRESGIHVHISHLKVLGPALWGRSREVIEMIRRAREEGVSVTADQYPYPASSTSLSAALLPRWAQEGGREAMLPRLERASEPLLAEVEGNLRRRGGARRLVISSAPSGLRQLEGRNLAEVAAGWGVTPTRAALRLIREGDAGVVSFNMEEGDLRAFMGEEWVATASDGTTPIFGEGKPHPRGYGTFPRKLRKYVQEEGIISLPFAVRAATWLPAQVAGLKDRGRIQSGAFADLVVLDLNRVQDRATFEQPHQYAEGVVHLLINGVTVIRDGEYTGARPGRLLRGPAFLPRADTAPGSPDAPGAGRIPEPPLVSKGSPLYSRYRPELFRSVSFLP